MKSLAILAFAGLTGAAMAQSRNAFVNLQAISKNVPAFQLPLEKGFANLRRHLENLLEDVHRPLGIAERSALRLVRVAGDRDELGALGLHLFVAVAQLHGMVSTVVATEMPKEHHHDALVAPKVAHAVRRAVLARGRRRQAGRWETR